MHTLTHPIQLVAEKIMQETFHDHHTSISIRGRPTCNLRFANIDLMGDSNGELQNLTERLAGKSNGTWNGDQRRKEQDHDQQHEQLQCRY